MKEPESPVDVKMHEFEQLLFDVTDAAVQRERATSGYYRRAAEDYEETRNRLLGMIRSLLNEVFPPEANEDPSGQRREATPIGWMGDTSGTPFGPSDR